TGLEVCVEKAAVRSDGRGFQGQVAKNVFPVQLRDSGAAIDKAAGDGDAFVVVIFQRAHGAGDGINHPGGNARAAISWWRSDGAGGSSRTVGLVEQEVALFDSPAVVAADDDAVDLF